MVKNLDEAVLLGCHTMDLSLEDAITSHFVHSSLSLIAFTFNPNNQINRIFFQKLSCLRTL